MKFVASLYIENVVFSTHLLPKIQIFYIFCFIFKSICVKIEITERGGFMLEDRLNGNNIKKHFVVEYTKSTTGISMAQHHQHNHYEVYYLLSGERYYFIKDRTYHVQKGNLVLINSEDLHHTANISTPGFERIIVYFSKQLLDGAKELLDGLDLFLPFEKERHLFTFGLHEQAEIEGLLFSMLKLNKKDSEVNLHEQKLLLMQLLMHAYKGMQKQNTDFAYANSTHKTITEVIDYITTHFQEELNLDDIAERFFISPCYLSRTFKKYTDFTFSEYLNYIRIKEAKRLLEETDMNITEVGEASGFNSGTHFGRVFKAQTGMSPMAYKKIK